MCRHYRYIINISLSHSVYVLFMLFAMLHLIQLDVTVLINNENSRTLSIIVERETKTWRINYDRPISYLINYYF